MYDGAAGETASMQARRPSTVPALLRANLVVHSAGEGPPVILLHGLTSSHREWTGTKSALAPDYTCISWDAYGHGEHQIGTASPAIADLSRDLAAVVAAVAPRKPVVVGHCLGALTILEYVRRFGDGGLAGIVLVDQSPRMLTGADWQLGVYSNFTPADNLLFEGRLRRDPAEAYLHLLACGFNANALAEYEANADAVQRTRDRLRRLPSALLLPLWKSFVHKDYREEVASLATPLLAVLGGASNLYDAHRLGRWYADAAAHAQVVRYDHADHSPHRALPARFARDVADFAAGCRHRPEASGAPARRPATHLRVGVAA